MRDLQAGITYINAGTTGAEVHLPFGGVKATGNGHREAGLAALRQRGHYPINHTVVVKDVLLDAHPDLAADVFDAFAAA